MVNATSGCLPAPPGRDGGPLEAGLVLGAPDAGLRRKVRSFIPPLN